MLVCTLLLLIAAPVAFSSISLLSALPIGKFYNVTYIYCGDDENPFV